MKRGALSEEELREVDESSSHLLQRVLCELEDDRYPCLDENQKTYIEGTNDVFTKESYLVECALRKKIVETDF